MTKTTSQLNRELNQNLVVDFFFLAFTVAHLSPVRCFRNNQESLLEYCDCKITAISFELRVTCALNCFSGVIELQVHTLRDLEYELVEIGIETTLASIKNGKTTANSSSRSGGVSASNANMPQQDK